MEGSLCGDVIASVCSTTAGILANTHQVGESLIQFADAAEFASDKKFFLKHLEDFFAVLRQKIFRQKEEKTGAETSWNAGLPILPPQGKDSKLEMQNTPLSEKFVSHIRIIDAVL